MLVSKEKYNDVVAALKEAENDHAKAQKQLSQIDQANAELEREIEQLRSDALEHNALKAEISQFTSLKSELVNKIDTLTASNTELAAKLEVSESVNKEHLETIASLSNRAVDAPAIAVSHSDESGQSESINDFMKANRDDPMACIERLQKEGF